MLNDQIPLPHLLHFSEYLLRIKKNCHFQMKKKSVPFLVHFVGGKTVKYSKLRFRFTVRAGECQRVIEHSVIKENKNTKSKWNFFSLRV